MKVIKRDGAIVKFDYERIYNALENSYKSTYGDDLTCYFSQIENIHDDIFSSIESLEDEYIQVETIQDIVVESLNKYNKKVGKNYSDYRDERTKTRERNQELYKNIIGLIDGTNESVTKENGNKNPTLVSTQRDLVAGLVSKSMSKYMFSKDIWESHIKGAIHIHDLDYYANCNMYNCCLVNLKDMLDNGTVINGKLIETPHTLRTAMNVATQISAVVSSSQYGGQTMDISHLSPYLRKSMKIINDKYNNMRYLFKEGNDEIINDLINKEIKKEIVDSVQLMMYQFSTISGTNGQQPFISLALYINSDEEYKRETAMLIEEIFNQRIQGMKNENGVNEVMAFPKLLYFLDENNIYEGSEYYWLTELGAKCCSLTMNPDFISVKQMKKNNGFAYPPMGCRAFISVMEDSEGNKINDFFGRGNAGVCTLNLPFIALESVRDNKSFYTVLDKYLDMVREVGKSRWRKLEGVTTSVAPLLWEHGAISRKPKGTHITDIMEERGFTTTVGYSGIWETVFSLTGKKLTEKDGLEKGLEILKYIDSVKTTWNEEEPKYRFAIYGCPSENTTDKFARALKKEFGEVEGVSDRDFVTNSFHIHVEEKVDAFEKLNIEANFVPYSLGGVVNYIEVDNMSKNVPAVIKIMQHIYETINYAEINQELDICNECLFRGAMNRNEDLSRWECPNCGNTNQDTISVTRRLCGYINSSKEWSKGRTKDILSRVKHL